jgi:hypothetical protein
VNRVIGLRALFQPLVLIDATNVKVDSASIVEENILKMPLARYADSQ